MGDDEVTKDTSATESTLLIQKDVEAPAVNEEAAATTEQVWTCSI